MPQIAGVHTIRLVCLNVNTVGTIIEVEIVHVFRAHVDTERLSDLADGHSDGFCFFTVDLDKLLRIVRGVAGKKSAQVLTLPAGRDNLVRCGIKVLQGIAAKILKLELEAAEAADALNGGWFESHDDGAWDAEKFWADARHNFARRSGLSLRAREMGLRGANTKP